jgi:hypothetical protein
VNKYRKEEKRWVDKGAIEEYTWVLNGGVMREKKEGGRVKEDKNVE